MAEAIATARECRCTGSWCPRRQRLLRLRIVAAARRAGARFSVTALGEDGGCYARIGTAPAASALADA